MHAAPVEIEFLQKTPPLREPSRWWWPRSWWGLVLHASFAPAVLTTVLAIAELAGRSQVWWGMFAGVLVLLAGLACAGIGVLLAPFTLHHAARLFVWGTVAFFASPASFVLPYFARGIAFDRCAQRAQPLVDAIERFAHERGAAPEALADLVPEYLPAVPGTGMPACPHFEYFAGGGPDNLATGGFELRVSCWLMIFSDDLFVYWPSGDYPERMYHGHVRRRGAWAYVHAED